MSWTIVIPGRIPSGNHANKIGRGFRRGGIAYPKIVKTDEAVAYQQAAAMLVRTARPSGWKWDGNQVVVEYRFYITRNADATNLVKTVEDAVFPAIGVNDTYALPRTMSKEIVPARLERVEVTIVEEATAPPGHAKTTQVSDRCHACGAVLGQGGQIG